MSNSLFYKIKPNVNIDKHRLIELFFMDFIDDTCDNKIQYQLEREWQPGMVHSTETLRIDFEREEDTLAMYLRGVPKEFQQYLEIVDR